MKIHRGKRAGTKYVYECGCITNEYIIVIPRLGGGFKVCPYHRGRIKAQQITCADCGKAVEVHLKAGMRRRCDACRRAHVLEKQRRHSKDNYQSKKIDTAGVKVGLAKGNGNIFRCRYPGCITILSFRNSRAPWLCTLHQRGYVFPTQTIEETQYSEDGNYEDLESP